MHRYNRSGEKGPPEPTGFPTAKEGFEAAMDEVKDHFQEMTEEWQQS